MTGSTFTSAFSKRTGVVCFADTGSVTRSSQTLTIPSTTLPSKWGKTIPGHGAYSDNNGGLTQLNPNYQIIGNAPSATLIDPPVVGASLTSAVGKWVFNVPVAMEGSVKIKIEGDGSNVPFTATSPNSTCGIYVGGIKSKVGCILTSAPT